MWVCQRTVDQHLSNGLVGGECQHVAVACPNLCGRCLQHCDLKGQLHLEWIRHWKEFTLTLRLNTTYMQYLVDMNIILPT